MKHRIASFLAAIACAASVAVAAFQQGGGLQPPPAPPQNPVTPEKAVLGKILFWDEQLSSDDTVACGSCHRPEAGFGDPRFGVHPGADALLGTPDDLFTSPGVVRADAAGDFRPDPTFGLDPQLTGRKANDLTAALYAPEAFWDGRASSTFVDPQTGLVSIPAGGALESQVTGPPLSDVEMAHEQRDWGDVVAKLAGVRPLALATDLPADVRAAIAAQPDYPALFADAFGDPAITAERIAFAIATYERTLVPDETPWDRWIAGDPQAMTPRQVNGWNAFTGVANCDACHTPPVFSDNQFHNLGLRPVAEDAGRQDVTGNPADRGRFKTPSLRNAGLRSRFFHNGQAFTLDNGPAPGGVDDVYVAGGGPFPDNRDPLLQPIPPGADVPALFHFVETALTDPRVANGDPPFDRPTLRSERVPRGSNLRGVPTAGSGGTAPRILGHVPAVLGEQLVVGLADALGGARAVLVIADAGAPAQTLPNGATLFLRLPARAVLPVGLAGSGPGQGYATVRAALPGNPALWGRSVHVQWLVEDPGAPAGTASASRAAEIVLEG